MELYVETRPHWYKKIIYTDNTPSETLYNEYGYIGTVKRDAFGYDPRKSLKCGNVRVLQLPEFLNILNLKVLDNYVARQLIHEWLKYKAYSTMDTVTD